MSNAPKVDVTRISDSWHASLYTVCAFLFAGFTVAFEGGWRILWGIFAVSSTVLAIRYCRLCAKPRSAGMGERSSSCPSSARERT